LERWRLHTQWSSCLTGTSPDTSPPEGWGAGVEVCASGCPPQRALADTPCHLFSGPTPAPPLSPRRGGGGEVSRGGVHTAAARRGGAGSSSERVACGVVCFRHHRRQPSVPRVQQVPVAAPAVRRRARTSVHAVQGRGVVVPLSSQRPVLAACVCTQAPPRRLASVTDDVISTWRR
jgi:hypothetical protein